MADMIRVRVAFPAIQPENDDVEQLEFSYSVNGAEAVVELLPKETALKELTFPQDARVSLSLVYLDDATPTPNRSPASTREFVALDTVPPAAPGELGVEVIGEE